MALIFTIYSFCWFNCGLTHSFDGRFVRWFVRLFVRIGNVPAPNVLCHLLWIIKFSNHEIFTMRLFRFFSYGFHSLAFSRSLPLPLLLPLCYTSCVCQYLCHRQGEKNNASNPSKVKTKTKIIGHSVQFGS